MTTAASAGPPTRVAVNPVVRGFAPDPSVVRVGEWYYLATSTMEWFPTLPVRRSRDLVDWEYVGAVDTAVPSGQLHGVPDSAGVWAPALSHADGWFWIVYAVVRSLVDGHTDLEAYVAVTRDPAAGWSMPVRVPGVGFDPSLYHEEGRVWLVNLQNDHRPGGRFFDGIVVQELAFDRTPSGAPDLASLRAAGDPQLVLQGTTLLEGPKIARHDGWYLLLLAEGGTGWEHGVRVARSRHLFGPYELDPLPLLTSRDDATAPLQKAGHGELVRTPTGEWYLAHLAARPVDSPAGRRCPLGRETAIQRVVFDEGWPRLFGGGSLPRTRVDVPAARHGGSDADDDAPGYHWPWSTPREPVDESWVDIEARPGWTRMRGRNGIGSLWPKSLLARRICEHRAEIEVLVDADPRTFTEAAGLALYYGTTAYLLLQVTWAEPEGEAPAGQQWMHPARGRRVLEVLRGTAAGAQLLTRVQIDDGPVRLAARLDHADARFSWAQRGELDRAIGSVLDLSELSDDVAGELRFTGLMAGPFAMDTVNGSFTADFGDWSFVERPDAQWDMA